MTEVTESFWARCGDTTRRDRRNLMRMLGILAIWGVVFSGASQAIKRDLLPAGPIPWIVAALPSILAIFVILAYARYLREADELQRLINLWALAIGFGGTFFAIAGYEVFERLGAPAAEIGDITFVMPLFYLLGTFLAWRRYR